MVKFPASTPSQGLQLSAATEAQLFDWHTCWYPILFSVDLPSDRPYSFSIYGEPMVLFRDQEGELICLRDRCPHRLAKLSDGQVIDGRLECLYHGWQFGKNGNCLHIPHLLAGANIPERAKVQAFPVSEQQGIVWVWADDKILPDPEWPLEIPEVEQAGVFKVDTANDQNRLLSSQNLRHSGDRAPSLARSIWSELALVCGFREC